MSECQPTLQSLFFGPAATRRAPAVEKHDSMLEVKLDFAEKLPELPWHTVANEVSAMTGEILSLGVDDLLVEVWKTSGRLREYRDPVKHPPSETLLAPLLKHTIRSTYNPAIKVLIADSEVATLDFQIQLALALEGIVLKIRAGKIHGILAGSYQVTGTLLCVVTTGLVSKVWIEKQEATAKHRFGEWKLRQPVEI